MERNFYESTRETILQKHRNRIAEADTARDEELNALEKLRPYWETIPTNSGALDVASSKNGATPKNSNGATSLKGVKRSDFPDKVRTIVKENFLSGNKVTQPLVYDILVKRFPEELISSNESNIRSRISKALKRLATHKALKFIGKSSELGNAHIYRKASQPPRENFLNFEDQRQETENLEE